jgi:tetratricopeptide (TPR) repeat protein
MYLRSSKYHIKRSRPPRFNLPAIAIISLSIIGLVYFQQFIIPIIPKPFVPTATPTRSAASFAEEADQLFLEGKLQSSIEMYERSIRANPVNSDLYIALSRVQVFARKYEDALENAQNAVLRSKSALSYAVYGEALHRLGNTQTGEEQIRSYTEAENQLRHSLSLDPGLALAHAYLSELIMDSDPDASWKTASAEARTALELAPNLMESHRAMAYMYMLTDNRPEASAEYQAAIALHPRLADLYIPYGDTLLSQQLTQDAIDAYLQASALDPQNPIPPARISRAYAGAGQYGKAQQFAEDALVRAPLDPRYHGLVGVMLYFNRDYLGAITELSLAIAGGETTEGTVPGLKIEGGRVAEYYWTYGLALAKVDRCSEAIPVLRLVEQTVANDPTAMENVTQGLVLCKEITPTPGPAPVD